MERDKATKLIAEYVKNKNLAKHVLAVEAIMKGVAEHLSEDEDKWGLAGLLHDLDFSLTEKSPDKHTLVTSDILKGLVAEEILRAIKAHNVEHTSVEPRSRMEKALIAADAISGLLVAAALVMPSKKLKDVSLDTVKKKIKQKDFARAVNRDRIVKIREIELDTDKFYQIALDSVKKISKDLGL